MVKITLFGTGNLGKRYIQAISGIDKDINIDLLVYDIKPEALLTVPEFIKANNITDLKCGIAECDQQAFDHIDGESIVIVATTVIKRMDLMTNIILKKPKSIICEKPVVQNDTEYLKLIGLLDNTEIQSFVNFTLRMQPFYQKIKEDIGKTDSGLLFVNLPRTGLACVGIHQIDLFLWLFDLHNTILKGSTFAEIYEQKRAGFYDVSGSIILENPGFRAIIVNSETENIRTAQIIAKGNVFNVNEDQRTMTKLDIKQKSPVIVENIEYSFVSQYMSEVILQIINEEYDKINLPNIKNSYIQHKILFDYFDYHSIKDLNFS